MGKVLVVDDEIHVLDSLKEFLAALGHEVYTAADGLEAVKKAKDERPDVVLLDIIMPGMGGIGVLEEIKKIEPSIVVVMLTALTDEEIAKTAMNLGAFDYVTKPIDLHHLEEVVMVAMVEAAR